MKQTDLPPRKGDVTVARDHTEVVDLSPSPVPGEPAVPVRSSRLARALPLAAMGLGAASMAFGGVLIALDQQKVPLAPERVHVSATAGIGFSVAGAAVAIAGAYFWFRSPEATSAPVAAVTANTAYVGWLARF